VKRRSALKHISAGLSAGLVLPWLSSCKDEEIGPEIKYDGLIGIIGAGAAGLFAGDYLLNKGINVEIFEASPRIGGRVRVLRSYDTPGAGFWFNQNTALSSDFPVELGADRILGNENSRWHKFIKQQNYLTFPLSAETSDLYFINNALLEYTAASAIPGFQNAESFRNGIPTMTGSGASVQQAIQSAGIDSSMFSVLEAWVGNTFGTTNDRLGIHGIAEAAGLRERTPDNHLLDHNPMADVLIGSFIKASEKVQLNTVVKQIDYSGEKVIVSGERISGSAAEPFTATFDKVIVTVPITILQSGDITFNPPLPSSKSSALSKMGMDTAIRVLLDFRKNFWGSGFRNIYGGDKGTEYFNPGASGRSSVARTLSVTVSGKRAEDLSALGVDVIPALLEELDLMFDGQASPNVRRDTTAAADYIAVIQDWGKEQHIRGSISYLKPGGSNQDRVNLSLPVNDVLFFAGEATDIAGEAGTVNGALQSAERVALEVISSITGS
jgi:monoamine oxidase